jgi:hypothetical protein
MTPSEIKAELFNAFAFIEGALNTNHYSDFELEGIHETLKGVQEAINLIDELLIDGTLED